MRIGRSYTGKDILAREPRGCMRGQSPLYLKLEGPRRCEGVEGACRRPAEGVSLRIGRSNTGKDILAREPRGCMRGQSPLY